MRIVVHAAGARRGAGAGYNRVLTMAETFPELGPRDQFLFVVRPDLAKEVRTAAPGAAVLSPPEGMPIPLRVAWEQVVLPFKLGRWEPDVIFGAFNLLPLWLAGKRPAYILMVTNLLPFWEERRTYSGRIRLALAAVRWLTLMSIKRADMVLLLSPHARELIGKSALGSKSRILPPAVPKARPGPRPARTAGEHVFVVAADLNSHKSIETAVRALSLAAIPGARLKVFGRPSDEGYERALRSEITRLGLEGVVGLEGWIERSALLEEMAASDACIAPISIREPIARLVRGVRGGGSALGDGYPGDPRGVRGRGALLPSRRRTCAGRVDVPDRYGARTTGRVDPERRGKVSGHGCRGPVCSNPRGHR